MKTKLQVGSKFRLTDAALENYGEKYRGEIFTVSHVAVDYMPAREFYANGQPIGFHPGYDKGVGNQALYDAKELKFSVYDWEVEPA